MFYDPTLTPPVEGYLGESFFRRLANPTRRYTNLLTDLLQYSAPYLKAGAAAKGLYEYNEALREEAAKERKKLIRSVPREERARVRYVSDENLPEAVEEVRREIKLRKYPPNLRERYADLEEEDIEDLDDIEPMREQLIARILEDTENSSNAPTIGELRAMGNYELMRIAELQERRRMDEMQKRSRDELEEERKKSRQELLSVRQTTQKSTLEEAVKYADTREKELRDRYRYIMPIIRKEYRAKIEAIPSSELSVRFTQGYLGKIRLAAEHILSGKNPAELTKMLEPERLDTYVKSASAGVQKIHEREKYIQAVVPNVAAWPAAAHLPSSIIAAYLKIYDTIKASRETLTAAKKTLSEV